MRIQKIIQSIFLFFIILESFSIEENIIFYSISDNYMHSYSVDVFDIEDITIEFTIEDKNFHGNKKGIFIYLDDIEKETATHTIWAGDILNENDSPYKYTDLELTAFLFRQKDGEKDYNQFALRLQPKKQYQTINIRVETTDEGIVFYSGERVNRIFGVTFKYGYNEPFYIASSYNKKKKAILYIDQESGLFPIDFINQPSETHILPLKSDKHFDPIKGHFSPLETKFEILHINRGEPGFANYYIILDNISVIDNKDSLNLFHLNKNEKLVIKSPNYTRENLNIKIIRIMGNSKVNGKVDEEEIELNETINKKYLSITKINGNVNFEFISEEDSIISISIVRDMLYTISEMKNKKTFTDTRYLLLTFPRIENENSDYSSIKITIKTENNSPLNAVALMGKELTDYLEFVSDVRYSCNYLFEENIHNSYLSIKTENPYDMWNITISETYYLAIVLTSDKLPTFTVEVEMTPKDFDIMIKALPNEFIYLKSKDDYINRYLIQRKPVKNQGFYLMIHLCNYDSSRKDNVIMLNYFEERTIWSSVIRQEYQVFKLTNNYQNMDFQIGNFDINIDYKDYIMTYYQVSLKKDFYLGPDPELINQKIYFLKSRVYNFELQGNILQWNSHLSDENDNSGIYVTDKIYYVCTLEDTEENRKYATNECFIEDKLQKNEIECSIENEAYTELNEGQKNYIISVFESVNLPVKVRYPIGIFKYGKSSNSKSDKEEIIPKDIGNYQQLVKSSSIYAKAYNNTYIYFDLSDFEFDQNGVITVSSTKLKEMYNNNKFQGVILATNLSLSKNLFDSILDGGSLDRDLETYKIFFGYNLKLKYSEILFTKKRFNKIYNKYILLMKVIELEENLRFNGVGQIIDYTISQDIMLSKTINFKKLGIPIYIHIKISDENFEATKKGLFIYTDNIEKNYGTHQVYTGTPMDHDEGDDESFYNYPLSAFRFRNEQNAYGEVVKTGDSVTVIFYPKKIDVRVKLNIQTTDEGIVIYSKERVNRVFQALFSVGYNEPFYIVCTYPVISEALLFIEQESGRFQIEMINKPSDSHILPNKEDKSFIPDDKHFSILNTYYEILHISQIYPGKALFHYILNYNIIANMKENSVEKIHIQKNIPFYLNTPLSTKENQKINIKIKNVMTTGKNPSDALVYIEENNKNISIPLKKEIYLSTTIKAYNNKKTLTFYNKEDTILIVTITMGDNIYKEVNQNSDNLQSKYLLYKFPKNNKYFLAQIKITPENYDYATDFEVYAVTGIEYNSNYIPDPRFSTNYLSFTTSGLRGNYFAVTNPYDLFKIKDEEFYYFSMVITSNFSIQTYSFTVNFISKKEYPIFLKQNELYKFENLNENEIVQLESMNQNPEGLTIMAHICGYKDELAMKNLLYLNYQQLSVFRKYINEEYSFISIGSNYNGMNVQVVSNIRENNYNNVIISYVYSPSILEMYREEQYIKKVRSLQSEKYIFDYSNNILRWTCSNCENDDSELTTINFNYLVCLMEDNLNNIEFLTNQCFIDEKRKEGIISCEIVTKNEMIISREQLSKIVVIFKESNIPLLIRTFVGYYRYKDDNSSGGTRSVGKFVELSIGQELKISSGKYFLKLSSKEIEYGNSGVIALLSEKINGVVKAGFSGLVSSESEYSLNKILDDSENVIINLGINTELSNKISEIIYSRESKEEVDYYLVLDFNLESRTTVFISGPINKFIITDNNMRASLIQCYNENGPIYASIKIEKNNFVKDKKGIFIYLDDIENNKATHEIYIESMTSPKEVKSNYPLTSFLFRKEEEDEQSNFVVFIRILPIKTGISVNIRIQTTDEGIMILEKERISRVFGVSFTFSRKDPFYIVSTHPDFNDEFYLYIRQKTGTFPISIITEPSPSHIIPSGNDKHFIPLEGHFSKLKGYFTIIHVSVENYGLAEFYFINGQKDIKIKSNSLNNFLVEYGNDNYYDLPQSNRGYYIKAECLMCNNSVALNYESNKIEINNKKMFQGKLEFSNSPKISLHSTGGSNIISLTVMVQEKLFTVISESKENLNSQFLLIKYPKGNYKSITVSLDFKEDLKDYIKAYFSNGITSNENYIPDPRNSFNLYSVEEKIKDIYESSSLNPYDYFNIPDNEFYYMNLFIEKENDSFEIPKYSIKIETTEDNTKKNSLKTKNNEISYLKLNLEEMAQILVENKTPKAKIISLYIHSCRFDSKQEKNQVALSYFDSVLVWGNTINREYQIFNVVNEYNNVNIVILPYKLIQNKDYNDFVLTYYLHQDSQNEIPTENQYNQKIDKLRSQKHIIYVDGKTLKWELNQEDVDKGNDGTGIKVLSRKYLICQMDNLENNRKYVANECFIESMINSKQLECKRVQKQEYDLNNVDSTKLVVIYQEIEIPIKIRLYIGIFDSNTYITSSRYALIFRIIIGILIIFLLIILFSIFLTLRSPTEKSNSNLSKAEVSMSIKKETKENENNALEDEKLLK